LGLSIPILKQKAPLEAEQREPGVVSSQRSLLMPIPTPRNIPGAYYLIRINLFRSLSSPLPIAAWMHPSGGFDNVGLGNWPPGLEGPPNCRRLVTRPGTMKGDIDLGFAMRAEDYIFTSIAFYRTHGVATAGVPIAREIIIRNDACDAESQQPYRRMVVKTSAAALSVPYDAVLLIQHVNTGEIGMLDFEVKPVTGGG
jgi:hypothetical protein